MTHYMQILQSELQRCTGNMWWDKERYEDGFEEHNQRVALTNVEAEHIIVYEEATRLTGDRLQVEHL